MHETPCELHYDIEENEKIMHGRGDDQLNDMRNYKKSNCYYTYAN